MRSSFHLLREHISIQSQSNCCHLSYSKASVYHMTPPALHGLPELRKVFGNLILSYILHDISYIPKVSPLSIEGWRKGSIGLVSFCEAIDYIIVVSSGLFCVFWSSSHLEMELRENISNWSFGIEIIRSPLEELLHQINQLIVLFSVNSRIFDDNYSIFMQRIGHRSTILRIIS